jgi:hypothetical protein
MRTGLALGSHAVKHEPLSSPPKTQKALENPSAFGINENRFSLT